MAGLKIFIFSILLLSTLFIYTSADNNDFLEQLEEMGIDSEMFQYKDLYTLTSSNFSSGVLRSFDPWVVVLHTGSVSGQWKEAAVRSRGVVWFGMVNVETEKHLVREMKLIGLDRVTSQTDMARVYPWGKQAKTEGRYRDVQDASAALDIAYKSLPLESIKAIDDSDDLNDLVMDCLLTAPTRFPAIFIYDHLLPFPPSFKSISIHLRRYFNFGRLDVELAQELVHLGVKKEDVLKAPTLIVVTTKLGLGRKLMQKGIRCQLFDESADGVSNMPSYTQMLECLYSINSRHRRDLPGNNMYDDEEVSTMEDVLEQEQRRFQVTRGQPAILASPGRETNLNVEIVEGEPPQDNDAKVEL